MATSRRTGLYNDSSQLSSDGRELFEACRNGDLNKVKKLLTTYNVNARDKAGRKSSPLHFAAGRSPRLARKMLILTSMIMFVWGTISFS